MTRAEAKWAIANPETLKAMADGDVIQYRRNCPDFVGEWTDSITHNNAVELEGFEWRKKPDPAPANEPKRWLIWSNKHNAWWGCEACGYFTVRKLAGRYTFNEACEIVRRSNRHGQDRPSSAMVEDTDHE